jgi:uncharacterized membrane protein YkgB
MRVSLPNIDRIFIGTMQRLSGPVGRLALVVVYFWFGILKVVGASPASPLVTALQTRTLPMFDAGSFLIVFGVVEVIIGVCFIVPRAERVGIALMAFHMVTTALPLVLLQDIVWSAPLVPTLEGQYIIKNLALVAVAMALASRLPPMRSDER